MAPMFQVRAISEMILPSDMLDTIVSGFRDSKGPLHLSQHPSGGLTYDANGNRLRVIYDLTGESRNETSEKALKIVSEISIKVLSAVISTIQGNVKYPAVKGIWIEWIKTSGNE